MKKELTQVDVLLKSLRSAKKRGITDVCIQLDSLNEAQIDDIGVSELTGVTIYIKKDGN